MARRTKERESDDPLRDEMSRLAERYGDVELLRICTWTIQRYAELGARQALVKRKGDSSIACETCRERQAVTEQFEKTLKKLTTGRPLGGAAPSQTEGE